MIAYDLKCKEGHIFEGWFKDVKAFKKQQKANLIACPMCEDTDVARVPSTFAIKGTPTQVPEQAPQISPEMMARAISKYVDKTFDNVGADFASEALKIHYGVNEPRNISGSAPPRKRKPFAKRVWNS